jgi:glycosyltransferase involved in cell wall biosynthesis
VWSRQATAEIDRQLSKRRYDVMHVHNHFPLLSPAIHGTAANRGVATVQQLSNYRLTCANAQFFRQGKNCFDCRGSFAPWRGVVRKCYRNSRTASLVPTTMVALHKAIGSFDRHIDSFVAVSEHVRAVHLAAGFDKDRIHVRYNPVGTGHGPAQLGTPLSIVAPLRLTSEKGINVLIRAWQRRKRNAVLMIAGTGPLETRLRSLVHDDSSIQFLGQVPHDKLMGMMAKARAVVNPSIWNEPLGRTPAEAFSVGTPAIVSMAGGLPECVEHGVNGLLVNSGNVDDLDGALTFMISDNKAHAAMSRAAYRTFLEKFHDDRILAGTEAIYEAAIRRRRSI